MEWLLKYGKSLDYLLEIADSHPDDIPAPLLSQPELPEQTAAVLGAFLALSESRSSNGYGPNPISVSDISAYLWINPICEARRFFALVRTLDRVFLDWHAKEAEALKK